MDAGSVFAGEQAIAELCVAEHLRQLAENLQVQIVGALWHQQHENQVHRLTVRRVEWNRLGGHYKRGSRSAQLCDTSMWNRHALSQACGAELLACEQTVEYLAARDLLVVFKQQANALKHAFLAGGFSVQQDVVGQQDFADQVHYGEWIKMGGSLLFNSPPKGRGRLPPLPAGEGWGEGRRWHLVSWQHHDHSYSAAACLPESSWRRADSFSLCFITWRSSLSTRASIAAYRFSSSHSTNTSLPLMCTVASAFCFSLSTERMMFTSITLSK